MKMFVLPLPGWAVAVLVAVVTLWTSDAAAQGRSVGGHVGVALPLVSRSQGETTMLVDDFAIIFPMGVVLRLNTGLPIDLAVVPTLHKHRVEFSMGVNTIHGIGHGFAVGGGVFVDVSNRAWGFAPAFDRVLLHMAGGRALVGDLFVPVAFHKDTHGARYASIGVATHVGVAF